MMSRVMDHVVKKITEKKSGEGWRRDLAEDDEEQSEKEKRQRNADDWRHDQPAGVFRIIVVNPVEKKMELLSPAGCRLVVEHPAMHRVFGERPNEKADNYEGKNEPHSQAALAQAEIE